MIFVAMLLSIHTDRAAAQLRIGQDEFEGMFSVPSKFVIAGLQWDSEQDVTNLMLGRGEGLTWDFSKFRSVATDTVWYRSAILSDGVPTPFTGSTYVLDIDGRNASGGFRHTRSYFTLSTSLIEARGATVVNRDHDGNVTDSSTTVYDPPLHVGELPIELGARWTYSHALGKKEYEYTSEVEATGTLILPGGQSEEALRVRTVRTEYPSSDPDRRTVYYAYTYTTLGGATANIETDKNGVVLSLEAMYHPQLPTYADNRAERMSATIRVGSNFPNPIRVDTRIPFTTYTAAKVKVGVYNTLGQKVGNPLDDYLQPGEHMVTWNASGLPSGTYVCRFEVDDLQSDHLLVVVR